MDVGTLAKKLHPDAVKVVDDTEIQDIASEINSYHMPSISTGNVDSSLARINEWEDRIYGQVTAWIDRMTEQLGQGWGNLAHSIGHAHLSQMYKRTKDYLSSVISDNSSNKYAFQH